MVEHPLNDNSTAVSEQPRGPDAHGQAAMLLVESLIHGLIARAVISVAEAIEIVKTAMEIKVEIAAEAGDSRATMQKSLTILQAINTSLSNDHADASHGKEPSG